ncbi:hypothetical protein K439DRAFT_1621885 [Ramaria rubella]|nr:hypothetical protein K439DRAFT_1621885 [Ramaria rubella]
MVHPSTKQHAIALLSAAEKWGWQNTSRLQTSGEIGDSYQAITSELLSAAIIESNQLGGSLLDKFWENLAKCHSKLKETGIHIRSDPESIQPEMVAEELMQGLRPEEIDFSPVLNLAAEVFTHLGIAFLNPGEPKSKPGTPFSVGELDRMETDTLLAVLNADGNFGHRKQAALKQLAIKRDGKACVFTKGSFKLPEGVFSNSTVSHIDPVLAHIIPNSFHQKPDTLALISMFAVEETAKVVLEHLNSVGNVMNIQSDAHTTYDQLLWGIEAQERDGKVKYVHRLIGRTAIKDPGPGFIVLKDGDEINFGQGPDGEKLGNGPVPLLCNLHLAVARIVQMSGAADIIAQWMDEADDSDFPNAYLASDAFIKILTAKLQLAA